ncbi:MAG: hypothetical protein DRP76_03980 [Candidatus Omnitrophota bacterium]|nr:MAG: hypothetical protein DRP76_03980 [Candidatus Omnitrophota bacterium]
MKIFRAIIVFCLISFIHSEIVSIYHSQISLRRIKNLGPSEVEAIVNIGISLVREIEKLDPNDQAYILIYFLIGMGKLEEALRSVQAIENEYLRTEYLQFVALAYYKSNEKERAIETLEEALEVIDNIDDDYWHLRAMKSIMKTCRKIGEDAVGILDKALEIAKDKYEHWQLVSLYSAMIRSSNINLDELERDIELALTIRQRPDYERYHSVRLILNYEGSSSRLLTILEKALQVAQIIEVKDYRIGSLEYIAKAWASIASSYKLSHRLIDSYLNDDLSPEEKILLGVDLNKERIDAIAKNDYDKALMYYGYCLPLSTSDSEILDWAKQTFKAEEDVETKKVLLDLIGLLARKKDFKALGFLEGKVRNEVLSRDLNEQPITEVELHLLRVLSEINQRTLVSLIIREDVPLDIREEFVHRLAGKGTIDEGLAEVLEEVKRAGGVEEFFSYLRQVYEEFNIIVPAKLMEQLLTGGITISGLRQYIPEIEGAGFEELIGLLKRDEKARLTYYCLKQPKWRYSVGAYTYEKFSRAIEILPDSIEGANDLSVLEELRQALVGQVGEEQAEFIISQIKQGRAPLIEGSKFLDEEGRFIPQEVSLEYSNHVRQDMERMLRDTYRGLVALLKLNYVVKQLGIEIEEMTTSDAMEEKLNELLEGHPELREEAGRYLADLTRRMKSDRLLGALLQVTDAGRIRSLADISEPDLDKFLGYLKRKGINLEEVMDALEEELADTLKPTYGHLRDGFENIIRLSEQKIEVEGRLRSRKVYIRYADKDDLIGFLRFADGAQCCISTNRGHLNYVPYALADYMSHVFVLVDERKNQIGYILTHYGIGEGGEPVLLSLQAYIKEGYYTEEGLKNIWEVMSEIARDMGVSRILQASKSYGLGRKPDWLPRGRMRVKKLQSVRSNNLVDDLGLFMNRYNEDEFYVIDLNLAN